MPERNSLGDFSSDDIYYVPGEPVGAHEAACYGDEVVDAYPALREDFLETLALYYDDPDEFAGEVAMIGIHEALLQMKHKTARMPLVERIVTNHQDVQEQALRRRWYHHGGVRFVLFMFGIPIQAPKS